MARIKTVIAACLFGLGLLAAMVNGNASASDLDHTPSKSNAAANHTNTAASEPFDRDYALAKSRAAIGQLVGDHKFKTIDGEIVSVRDFAGHPVLINFIYTSCSHTCPMIIEYLSNAVAAARAGGIGDDLVILTVGFDVDVDTQSRMRSYRRERGVNAPGWRFLSGDREAVAALARDTGFIFSPAPYGYDHIAQTTLVDFDGRVFRQIYGGSFEPPVLVEPLKDLINERSPAVAGIEDIFDQVRLFCTIYDPNSGTYRFDNSLFISIFAGAFSLTLVGVFLLRELMNKRRTVRR